jgi:hypothetical protein
MDGRNQKRNLTMSKFVHVDMPLSHPGVERLENAVATFKTLPSRFDEARAAASMLLAAVVSALLLAANTLIKEVTDGHLLLAWVMLWLVGFVALVLLAKPMAQFARSLRTHLAAWKQAQRAAKQDARLWNLALGDARVMADIRAAMMRGTD